MTRTILTGLLLLLTTEVSAQWTETRRVFVGSPDERTVTVPYYIPYTADPDFGWGFFYDYRMVPEAYRTPEYQRLCMRQMASIGLNTFTAVGWGGKDLTDVELQLRIAIEEGLAKRPVLVLPTTDPASVAKNLKLPPGSPEVIGYGPDEPALSQEFVKKISDEAAKWHSVKMRVLCSMTGAAEAEGVGEPLDIWMIQSSQLGNLKPTKKELWVYNSQLRGTNAPLHRYLTGIYAYAAHRRLGVKGMFVWTYTGFADSGVFINPDGSIKWAPRLGWEHALPGPQGPLMTVGMEGMREGIIDFKILHEVERRGGNEEWLDQITKDIPLNFWDGTDSYEGKNKKPTPKWYRWDDPDTARPNVDMDAIREAACERINISSPPWPDNK